MKFTKKEKEEIRIRAQEIVNNKEQLAYDVAASHGQIFENVKHMKWFLNEVEKELMNDPI